MEKRTEINKALKEAMKSQDKVALSTIRLILAALRDRDMNARGKGNTEGLQENDILSILQSMIKQRKEASKTYREAKREDLAVREEEETAIISRFLPQQMGEDEVEEKVRDLIVELGVSDIKEMGKVMAELKTRYAGKLDMSRASGMVKERLAG